MIMHTLNTIIITQLCSYYQNSTVGLILTLEHIHVITEHALIHKLYARTHTHTHTPHTVHGYVNNYTNHTEPPLGDGGTCTGLVVITSCHTQWLARHSHHRLSNSTTVYSCGIVFWGVALNDIHWYGIRGRVALECKCFM